MLRGLIHNPVLSTIVSYLASGAAAVVSGVAGTFTTLTATSRGLFTRAPGAQQATPTIALGDGDTGFYEAADDYLVAAVAGVAYVQYTASEVKPLVSFKPGASFGLLNPVTGALTGNTDNWSPTGIASVSVLRITSDGAYQLTGLGGNNTGKLLLVANTSAFTITLMHDVTSTAANRFYCPGSVDFSLLANASVWLYYDATSARWRVLG